MQHTMSFEMNGRKWDIVEGAFQQAKEVMSKGELGFQIQDMQWFGGYCDFTSQTIFINSNLCDEAKIHTLLHELCHCYIVSYIKTTVELEYYEEVVCDIVANSHYIIHDIVESYKEVLWRGAFGEE